MSAKDTNQTPPDDAVTTSPRSRWTKILVWVGGVLTTAVVVPVVAWAVGGPLHWFTKIISPEEYLSATARVPSSRASCQHGGEGWVFNKDPQHLPMVLPRDDVDAWAAANGGIPASGNYVTVDLQARNGHTVVLDSISINVVSRTNPLQGTWANTWAQCGGLKPYRFQANLDTTPLTVTAIPDEGAVPEGEVRRPVELPHSISASDPTEVWNLTAVTTSCTCEWTATLNWTSEGRQGHTDITNNGHPFRVAAVTRSTRVLPGDNGWMIVRPQS